MCTHFSVFIQNIHLQNTDFEVIHKRNKYYLISIFLTQCWGGGTLIRYQPHPLSRLPFHAFNVVLASCDHFRTHFGQNVISSLSMPMVSNRPYSFFSYCVYARSHRQTLMLTRHSQNHNIILVRSYNKTMDGLVIKKKLYFHSERKKKLYFHWDRKKNCTPG